MGGHASILDELLTAGADVGLFDEKGHTALLKAAIGGHGYMVSALIEHKADLSTRDALQGLYTRI